MVYDARDSLNVAEMANLMENAIETIQAFLGVLPERAIDLWLPVSREAFTGILNEAWGIPETACWMVGTAVDERLVLLSPSTWETDACL